VPGQSLETLLGEAPAQVCQFIQQSASPLP
jgi:hypothetical protein